MTAKIGLEDVRIHAPHGFYEEEHRMGNEFSIDVEVEATITGAAQNDDLGGTVNYATIYYLLQAEMKKPTQLLEALAYRMGNRILNQFDSVRSVRLRLRKLNPPLGGKVGAAVVEVNLGVSTPPGFGGRAAPSMHTFEDRIERFPEKKKKETFGGGMRGLSGLSKPAPPPRPVAPPPIPIVEDVDDSAFAEDDEEWEDMEELTPEEIAALEAGEYDELEYEDEDDDFGDELTVEQLDALRNSMQADGLDFDKMFGDLLPPEK
ncbi:MAG: dihydroneopterin aldolase [Bacteroidota bacterium]